ncbi:hypothetical protein DRJ17_00650 [Candidatus Woesearchaeota archaeon]|nr:MAG: hypothetical protein DRJ17_00650 [Candidatus Woesearchaeota archaeon]
MEKKVLEISKPRKQTDEQCLPCVLYTIILNQFKKDKRVNLKHINYRKIKNWVGYNPNSVAKRMAKLSGRDLRLLKEMYHGVFELDKFHLKLNQNLKTANIVLRFKVDFSLDDLKFMIESGVYPILLINPKYINNSIVINPHKIEVRGEDPDYLHAVVIHGFDSEHFYIYDPDLVYNHQKEVLNLKNIRVKTPHHVLSRFASTFLNRVYWFEPIEKSEKKSLNQWLT